MEVFDVSESRAKWIGWAIGALLFTAVVVGGAMFARTLDDTADSAQNAANVATAVPSRAQSLVQQQQKQDDAARAAASAAATQ